MLILIYLRFIITSTLGCLMLRSKHQIVNSCAAKLYYCQQIAKNMTKNRKNNLLPISEGMSRLAGR